MSPDYASDEAMQLYKETVAQYQPEADVENGIVAYGWTQAAVLIEALEAADAPTRLAVMESVRNLDLGDDIGLLAEGTGVVTSEDDPFMGETFNIVQYDAAAGYFNIVEPLDYEGETGEITPESLITAD